MTLLLLFRRAGAALVRGASSSTTKFRVKRAPKVIMEIKIPVKSKIAHSFEVSVQSGVAQTIEIPIHEVVNAVTPRLELLEILKDRRERLMKLAALIQLKELYDEVGEDD